jgi:uncharacterized membrane protein YraQ (UPF0718 family)
MEYALKFAQNFLLLLDAMSIYILVGLLAAGIIKQLVANDFVHKHLGRDSSSSVIKATIFGIPLPVCSCSVIPLAQSLRKEGACRGAVQSFLISTPITGVDSILATFSFFGLVFTVFRLISSIIIAIIVGLIQNFFDKKDKNNKATSFSTQAPLQKAQDTKKPFSVKQVFSYAFFTLFRGMAKALFIGLLLGALFTSFAPKEYTSILFENEILTYFVILIFTMPLYVCATASLPLGAALVMEGMSAGAAFVFLTAGPATSAITMSVVYKTLGKQSLLIYVSTIAFLSIVFGFLYDTLFSNLEILNFTNVHENTSLLTQLSSLFVLLFMIYFLFKERFSKDKKVKRNENRLKLNENIDFSTTSFTKK